MHPEYCTWILILIWITLSFQSAPAADPHPPHRMRLLESSDGRSHLDLEITGTFAVGTSTGDPEELELGGHDPHRRGFNLQGLEFGLGGTVDSYFRAQATILFGMEDNSEAFVEIEEAWMETTSLPWDVTVRAGQYLTQFGVLNPAHLHDWDFVDTPLVNARLLGPDGLRGPGGQISWHPPLPIHTDLYFSVQNVVNEHTHSHGGEHGHEEHGSFDDLIYSARWVASMKPAPSQILQGGGSVAYGSNDHDGNSTVIGGDLTWLWQPGGGSRFLKWQTEAIVRRTTVEKSEAFTDWGIYSQVVCGFAEDWTAALRGEYSEGGEHWEEPTRWRLSPALTYRPSENAKLRLQYNYDNIPSEKQAEHTVWVQFEFSLGTEERHRGHVH